MGDYSCGRVKELGLDNLNDVLSFGFKNFFEISLDRRFIHGCKLRGILLFQRWKSISQGGFFLILTLFHILNFSYLKTVTATHFLTKDMII